MSNPPNLCELFVIFESYAGTDMVTCPDDDCYRSAEDREALVGLCGCHDE